MKSRLRLHLRLIALIGLAVPRRLRADWRQEWEAELRHREALLADWERLTWRSKMDLFWRSTSAFADALWLQQLRWEDDMFQDLRYGVRMLRKNPGFTSIAVLTLALSIGVTTVILSTVNGFVLRPLSVEKPEELVVPFWGVTKDAEIWGNFSYANYIDLRDQNTSLSGLLAWQLFPTGISNNKERDAEAAGHAEIAWGELVSSNYFDLLGVKTALGRSFLPEENRTQITHPVVVLGHAFWQRRFNSDGAIVGKTIFLNGTPFTVIGVAAASFKGLEYGVRTDFWTPLMMQSKFTGQNLWETNRGWTYLNLLGRLKPGVTVAQADADVNLVAENLAHQYPKENADTKVRVLSEFDARFKGANRVLKFGSLLAIGVAGLVLLVACANVANLLLARAAGRRKEIGIRLAIGAGRWRLVRQLMTESVLLALLGGALSLLVAYWGTDLVRASFPVFPVTLDLDIRPDLQVMKWMLGVTLGTAMVFGLAPALLASRSDLVAVLKSDAAGQATGWQRWNLRGTLVVAQVTISVVVLVCAGLLLRSLNKALHTELGFRTDNLITMVMNPGQLGYEAEAGKRFYAELLKRIETRPGVRAASLTQITLLSANWDDRPILQEGEPDPPPNQGVKVHCNIVAPKYFETIGTPLVSGRDFTERDTSNAPLVAIVNQKYAQTFYGSEANALGKRIRLWNAQSPLMEIVGVAKDALYETIYETRQPYVFLPQYQQSYREEMTLLVSVYSQSDVKAAIDSVRQEIGQLDARVPVFGVKVGDENLSFAYWGPRLAAGLGSTFGLLALLLAAMGLYSVMTYAVSQRTREIGIRMALGAQPRRLLQLVVGQGMVLTLIGLVLGVGGAVALTRLLQNLLLDVSATDPLTFAAVALLMTAVAALASWVPARRASRVDPMVALRHE